MSRLRQVLALGFEIFFCPEMPRGKQRNDAATFSEFTSEPDFSDGLLEPYNIWYTSRCQAVAQRPCAKVELVEGFGLIGLVGKGFRSW